MKNLDSVVAFARDWLEAVSDARIVYMEDDAGGVWYGSLHAEWKVQEWRDLLGKVADLKSAYKQMPSSPRSASVSVIAVRLAKDNDAYFRALSLMFGTTAAVYGFLRISRAISALSCSLLVLDTIEFFDDFSMIQPARLPGSAESSFLTLLKLLGWQVADSAAKAKPFGKTFVTLGVQLDLNP